MTLTPYVAEKLEEMADLLTGIIHSHDTNPIERAYLDDVRKRLEAVRLMPVVE